MTHAGLPLRPSARMRRRSAVNRLMEGVGTIAALVAVSLLAIVVVSVFRRGGGEISWGFLTKAPAGYGLPGRGIASALVGTLLLVLLATAMALPVGVLAAIYMTELAPRQISGVFRVALDVLNGMPSIVLGIFVYGLIVVAHGQSGLAGAFALAIIMLPLVARSTQEVLRLVPSTLREGGLALGAERWRTVVGLILPTTFGGIITGTVLAVARAAGETAPLLFTSSIISTPGVTWNPLHALASIPFTIFQLSESPDPADHRRAWAAALVLIAFVLLASLAARALLARTRRKLAR